MNRTVKEKRPAAIPGLSRVCEAVIYKHVFSNAEREVGGVLVGRIKQAGAMPVVTGAIPAIAADEQRAALTFTQDSWEHVHRVLDSEYPGEQIVGWYHSHPSFGIFLSGHDLFIHRNFFSGRSQIALVVDPIACEEGVFAWRKSTNDVDRYMFGPTPAEWRAVASDGEALMTRVHRQPVENEQAGKSSPYPLAVVALAGLAGFAVAFAIAFIMIGNHGSSKKPPTASTSTTLVRSTPKTSTGG